MSGSTATPGDSTNRPGQVTVPQQGSVQRVTAGGLAPGQSLKTYVARIGLTNAVQTLALWTVTAGKTLYLTDIKLTHDGADSQTVFAQSGAAPLAGAVVAALANVLRAGIYEVRLQLGFGSVAAAGDLDNMRLEDDTPTTILTPLPALPVVNTFSPEFILPRVTVVDGKKLRIAAIANATAGAFYRARITATRIPEIEARIQAAAVDIWRETVKDVASGADIGIETQPQATAGQAVTLVLPAGSGNVDINLSAIEQ